MVTRLTAVVLVLVVGLGLGSTQAFAESIREAAAREALELAQAQRPAARGRNPYQTPAFILMGAGAGLTALAFLSPSGVKCEDTGSRSFGFECGTSANKGLLFTGLGVGVIGVVLFMRGENQRGPAVSPVAGGFQVTRRFKF